MTPLTPTAGRLTAGIVGAIVNDIGSVPPAEGMYGNETLGNGTERPDGRVRFGIGSETDVSTAQHAALSPTC